MRTSPTLLTCAIALLAAAPGLAGAQEQLFSAAGGDCDPEIVEIDKTDGSQIGSPVDPGILITGMAYHPSTGVIYASTNNQSAGTAAALYTVDPTTGLASLVGSFGLSSGSLADVGFDSDGTLYGWNPNSSTLHTVNLSTGAASAVGSSGITDNDGTGLSFGPGGTLYLTPGGTTGNLYSLNKITGAATNLGALIGGGTPDRISALAFDGTTVYGQTRTEDFFTLDVSTRTLSFINGADLPLCSDGLEFTFPIQPPAVPALTATGVALLGASLLGAVLLLARRASRNAA